MSKAQFIILAGVIGFYSALFVFLLTRICLSFWRVYAPSVIRMAQNASHQKTDTAKQIVRRRKLTRNPFATHERREWTIA